MFVLRTDQLTCKVILLTTWPTLRHTDIEIVYAHTLDIANAMEGYHLRSVPPEHTRADPW